MDFYELKKASPHTMIITKHRMRGGFFMGRNSFTNRIKQLLYKPSTPHSTTNGITAYLGEMSRDIEETFNIIRSVSKEEKDDD
jgi:hypothetical protein